MNVSIKGKKIIIEADVTEIPQLSKSGKTRIVASSGGNITTQVLVDGKPVTVGFNAYIKAT